MRHSLLIILFMYYMPVVLTAQSERNDTADKSLTTQELLTQALDSAQVLLDNQSHEEAKIFLNQSKALLFNIDNDTLEIDLTFKLGKALLKNSERDSSLEYLEKAYKKSKEKLGTESELYCLSTEYLGYYYYYSGDYSKAIEYTEKSAMAGKIVYKSKHSEYIRILANLGAFYKRAGHLEKAISIYRETLGTLITSTHQDSIILASLYNNLGTAHRKIGKLKESISYLNIAIEINQKLRRDIKVAASYENLGIAWYTIGDYEKARILHEKALAIKLKNDSNQFSSIGSTYNGLAIISSLKGDIEAAIKDYNKALAYFLKDFGPVHPRTAEIYQNLGHVTYRLAQEKGEKKLFDVALENFKEAITIFEKTNGKNYPEIANIYLGRSQAYLGLDQSEKARGDLNKAQAIWSNNEHNFDLEKGVYYVYLALIDINEENYKYAIENLNEALSIRGYSEENKIGMPLITLTNSINPFSYKRECYAALALKDNKYKDSLYHCHNEILNLSDQLYSSSNYNATKQYYMYALKPIYEDIIQDLIDDNHQEGTEKLFQYFEKNKSRILTEQLKKEHTQLNFNLPDSIIIREKNLNKRITEYDKLLLEISEQTSITSDSLEQDYKDQLFDLQKEKEDYFHFLKTNYPNYYRIQHDLNVVSIPEVQNELLQDSVALIEYFVGDTSIYAFVITKEQSQVIPIKRDFPLDEYINDFRKGISIDANRFPDNQQDSLNQLYTQSAYKLYQKLVIPLKRTLSGIDKLIIIPDDVIGYIPFDALLTSEVNETMRLREYPYFIKEYQSSYAYSATSLREMMQKKHVDKRRKNFLGVAPLFEGEHGHNLLKARNVDYANKRNDLLPLKYNVEEVRRLNELLGGEILMDTEATESAFLNSASQFQIIHLSTHGKANDLVGDNSFIAFYEVKDSVENEWLYNRELYNMELNADMVVLSACETGVGELQGAEGIISLARGFSYAGAKSIVTTLWSVDDEEAPELMVGFYEYLLDGHTKDAALRKSKLDYLSKSTKPHPYYWAGFIPIGDMEIVSFDKNNYYLVGLGFSVLLFLIFMVVFKKMGKS